MYTGGAEGGYVGRDGGQGTDYRGRGAYSGIWMIMLCNVKPLDVSSSGKRHKQNAQERDGCGSWVYDGLSR